MNKAAKIISDSIIGNDFKTVLVHNKAYTIQPPTIYRLSGAISCLAEGGLEEGATLKDVLFSMKDSMLYAKALSWFIHGDDSLTRELAQGSYDEVVEALEEAFSLISAQSFLKAVSLAKNVADLAAKQK